MERRAKNAKKQQDPLPSPQTYNIIFFHPDLGIGGAERLVVDAAVGLQRLGHTITIFTSHRDTNHCFDEARDGTLDVRIRGDGLIPASILGRFKILCSILRQIHLILSITWSGELAKLKPSAFFVDQLSAGIPFLRWFWEDQNILFYCHFPDLLLVQGRKRWYKRIWRIAFDWWEGWGIRGADRVVVNSGFTKGVAEQIWPGLGGERGVGVVYPCVNTSEALDGVKDEGETMWKNKKVLLSINRFERKKNVGLAVKAFAGLDPGQRQGVRLVIAGGYDTREYENVTYHKELESLASSLKLRHATAKNLVSAQSVPDDIEVLFLLSVPTQLKSSLLHSARLLIYTPSDEHFGIVPLEAMLNGVPVLAANNGGPLETVADPDSGWLRPVDKVDQWTEVMHKVLHELSDTQLKQMGEHGRRRVKEDFSETQMSQRFDEEFKALVKARRVEATELGDVAVSVPIIGCCLLAIGGVIRAAVHSEELHLLELGLGTALITVASAGIVGIIYRLTQNVSAFM
ncbi:Alpha-1,3-mannosyltransferase-like protein [Lecanora helva]